MTIRDRILDATVELFYDRGINATGVDLVASRAGVSKRTLYKYFPSKNDLVEHYLQRRVEMSTDPRTIDAPDARAKLLAAFSGPGEAAEPLRGCPLHNAAVEAAAEMPRVSAYVREQKDAFTRAVTDLCSEIGAEDHEALGRRIALIFEGAAAMSTSLNSAAPWTDARDTVEILVRASAAPCTEPAPR